MYHDLQLSTYSLNMASMDYLCWSNLVLGNLISDSLLLFAPKYHGMVAMFQLESI
jgi:hypothetical protein